MMSVRRALMIGKTEPKPPYPPAMMTTGANTTWRGYRRDSGQNFGSLTDNTWNPNPTAVIESLWHNPANDNIFLRILGISSEDLVGNWSNISVNTIVFQRSTATITTGENYVQYRWTGSNPFGNAGNTRTITIG